MSMAQTTGWESRAVERSLGGARLRSAARARRLVDAARRLVADGSAAFTVAQVCEEAGVSLRSFYRRFAGRDELLLALLEEEARFGAGLLSESSRNGRPVEQLEAAVRGLCSFVVAGSGYATLLFREHVRLANQYPLELQTALAPLLELLATRLRAAADAGEVRAVDQFDAATLLALALTHAQTAALLSPADTVVTRTWEFCRAALAPEQLR